ncbi:MAG TPA: xylose isomerase [Lentisphaeria bacterium]|nr:MAG: hypothetical protein A2X48_08790 [Lentisphaerae bacterium GWF2_49_21]HBC89029.1 xylose isomerase [Lentisphaeria bacterium]
MKIGVISDSLKRPLYESIKRSSELGAEGVQLYASSANYDLLMMDERQCVELKAHCAACGLGISAICGDLGGHGFQVARDNPRRVKTCMRIIDVTRQLGCNVVTMHVGVIPSSQDNEIYKTMLAALRELGAYAKDNNVVVAIETGPESSRVLKQFLCDAGTKGLGVNLDPANLIMILNEDPVHAVRTLGDYIVHTHAKDGVHYRDCDPVKVYDAFAEGGFENLVAETGDLFAELPLGEGTVNWDAYLKALKEIGFDGFLTIEREVGENPDKDIWKACEFLRHKIIEHKL